MEANVWVTPRLPPQKLGKTGIFALRHGLFLQTQMYNYALNFSNYTKI